ncbi:phage holin family protein [Alysiella crassa]|uniref:Predicted membrane protein n=1 Tax=Alysiella crassa TaxID=153491 RepID=A0A376BVA7_9NEIS|nr:phage holin family protein [Alysiella crassa]UOP06373.1 phage holin family protein [Alysiella crassa]SSY80886.1 Predicted membrane protein [Alysiella crassa]
MNLKQEYQHFKTLLSQGSDLLLLRLRLLHLDANAQLANIIKILVAVLVAAVLLLVGLIALMFALNAIVSPEMKLWVFGGMMVACVLVCVILLCWAVHLWRSSSTRVGDTLHALQDDLRLLKGTNPNRKLENHE